MTLDEVKAAMQAAVDALNNLDVTAAPVVDDEDEEVDIVTKSGKVKKFVIPTE